MTDREFAPAKLNLALHVRGRRDDGYHAIETLFAFVDIGDVVSVEPADAISVCLTGPFADRLSDDADNLVLAAARLLQAHAPGERGARLTLDKRLPVAAGIGGGSADAAATLRLLDRFWGLDLGLAVLMRLAVRLGADVPACLIGETAIGRDRGDAIEIVEGDLAGTPVLLVNPGVALPTAAVFERWDGRDRGPLPDGSPFRILRDGRNDLTAPAITLAPVIVELLAMLDDTDATLARMSGSGATCFAIYDDDATRDAAAERISRAHRDYWTAACRFD